MKDRELAEWVASKFHLHYENLAEKFGYITREDSRVEWEDVPEANRALMVETVLYVLGDLLDFVESTDDPIIWEWQSTRGDSIF